MLAAAERVAEKQTLVLQEVTVLLTQHYLSLLCGEGGHCVAAGDASSAFCVLCSHEVAPTGAFELDLAGGRDFHSFT